MDTRRYRTLSTLAVASLAAAALAGCGADARTGTVQVHAGSSAAAGAPSVSPVPVTPTPGAPRGAPGTGGRATPGPGHTGTTGTPTAKPVPLSSLTCGGPATAPGTLPDRDWAEAASCPVAGLRPGDGGPANQPGVPVVKHGDLAPLVSALHQPDAPRTHGMCPDYRMLTPTFWLVDGAGEAYQPRIPVNSCGQPSAAVVSALRALGLA